MASLFIKYLEQTCELIPYETDQIICKQISSH